MSDLCTLARHHNHGLHANKWKLVRCTLHHLPLQFVRCTLHHLPLQFVRCTLHHLRSAERSAYGRLAHTAADAPSLTVSGINGARHCLCCCGACNVACCNNACCSDACCNSRLATTVHSDSPALSRSTTACSTTAARKGRTHTHTRARTHTRTHARTQARAPQI